MGEIPADMSKLPTAKSVTEPGERERLRRVIAARGLCGLANNTKWDEFISAIRERSGWRPRFRCKFVDGPVSRWDNEWFYHLPFPLMSVEWLDISFVQTTHRVQLAAPLLTDHSPWIEELIQRVGLDYQKGDSMIRIFGYSPKSLEAFDKL